MEFDVINFDIVHIAAVCILSLPIANLRSYYVKLPLGLIKHRAMQQGSGFVALYILNPSILEEVSCLIFTWTNIR